VDEKLKEAVFACSLSCTTYW